MHPEFIDLILIFFVVTGIFGTLFPAMPGSTLIVAGALVHGLATDFSPLSMKLIIILASLSLLAWIGQYAITGAGSKRFGSTKYGAFGAIGGAFLGLILPIPGGIFVGAFAGAVICEIIFAVKTTDQALQAGIGAVLGTVVGTLFEFFMALIMTGIIVYHFINQ